MTARQHSQARIDEIQWYHDFDFGGGLAAHSQTPDAQAHRKTWDLIERQLDALDFFGKSVLDIGCWDGYWSFYAERRGAHYVLASDDATQNWSAGSGIHLAKELLGSSILIDQGVSIYELASLGKTFDIILCLGVYYHLHDPFYAFAQVRHCCHPGTVVVFEGDLNWCGMTEGEARYCFDDSTRPAFLPSRAGLASLLQATYLRIQKQAWKNEVPQGFYRRLIHFLKSGRLVPRFLNDRVVTVCAPFEGINPAHPYRPPFGLHVYDPRFCADGSHRDVA